MRPSGGCWPRSRVLLGEGDVSAIDGKVLRGARDKSEGARTRMMVSAYAARLRLTLATVAAGNGTELEAALEVLGLIALKGKVVTADALHCNRRTVAAITAGGGDYCLALKANQVSACPMPGRVSASRRTTTRWPARKRRDIAERRPATAPWFLPRAWPSSMISQG